MSRARAPAEAAAALLALFSATGASAEMAVRQCPAGIALPGPFAVRIERAEGAIGYSIRIGDRWLRGAWKGSGVDEPTAIVTDVNFDGFPDIWITGDADGQGRERPSDVWLYDPVRRGYIRSPELSALPNLEVDPTAREVESGIHNCGCAGACFDVTRWRRSVAGWQASARHRGTCTASNEGYRASPSFIDWRSGKGCR